MKEKRQVSPADIDAALEGSSAAPGLESLSAWASEMRQQTAGEISPDVAAAQIAVAAKAAVTANPGGAGYTALKPSRLERVRRRLVFGSLLSGIGAKVFAASVALATATGGVAATGSLPDTVQDPIASIYNSIGFDFPTSHSDDCAENDDVGCEDDEETDGKEAPATRDSDDVEDKDDPGDNKADDDDRSDHDDDDSDGADHDDEDGDDKDDDEDADDDDEDSDDKPGNNRGKGNNNKSGGGGGDDDGGNDEDQDHDDQSGGDEG